MDLALYPVMAPGAKLFVPPKREPVPARTALRIVSDYAPSGDQPQAIAELSAGIGHGERDQVQIGRAHV